MNKRQKVMTGRRNRHHGVALMLVMILVVVAGIMGMSYLTSSTVQMVSTNNLLSVSRARYLAESGIEHATWMVMTDTSAAVALQGVWMGPFHADSTADSYVFTGRPLENGLYEVTSKGTAHGITQTTSMTIRIASYYAQLVMAWGPISYWRLGESGGTTAADSVSGINGIYRDVSLGRTGAIVGDSNTAGQFDGTTSHVEVPHSDAFLVDNGTVLLWFNANVITPAGLFSKDSKVGGSGGHLTIETDYSGVKVGLQSTTPGKRTYHNLASQGIVAGEWYFVAFTFGSSGMKLYLNGQLADSNNYTGGLVKAVGKAGNHEPIAIGANTMHSSVRQIIPTTGYFTGRIDEVNFFGRALTAEQIGQLYDARMPGVGR